MPVNYICGINNNAGNVNATDVSFAIQDTNNPRDDADNIVKNTVKVFSIFQENSSPIVGTSTTRENVPTNNIDWINDKITK